MNRDENQRLNGWKEIADFVDKTTKTVQRWEKSDGFPVYRVKENKSVYAIKQEIDAWFDERLNGPQPKDSWH